MYVHKIIMRKALKYFFLLPYNSYSKPGFSIPKAAFSTLAQFISWAG